MILTVNSPTQHPRERGGKKILAETVPLFDFGLPVSDDLRTSGKIRTTVMADFSGAY